MRLWINTINTIFSGMNIHLPAILMFTRGTRFWHTAMQQIMLCLATIYQWLGGSREHRNHPKPGITKELDWLQVGPDAGHGACFFLGAISMGAKNRASQNEDVGDSDLTNQEWIFWFVMFCIVILRPIHCNFNGEHDEPDFGVHGFWTDSQEMDRQACSKNRHSFTEVIAISKALKAQQVEKIQWQLPSRTWRWCHKKNGWYEALFNKPWGFYNGGGSVIKDLVLHLHCGLNI